MKNKNTSNINYMPDGKITPERNIILEKLNDKEWFRNTDNSIKKDLISLPEDWNGYLTELANRNVEFGGVKILRLINFKHGSWLALTGFEVLIQQTKEIIPYGEYVTFKFGVNSGYRGIILLEVDGEIKYFILKRSEKFPIGKMVYDCIGGMIQYKNGELLNIPKKAESEIKRQLGLSQLRVKRFIDLGEVYPDVGRQSDHMPLFAAVIDINDAQNLTKLKDKTILNTKKISFEVLIEPIERINEYIHKVDDSYFLVCVLRLLSLNIIRL